MKLQLEADSNEQQTKATNTARGSEDYMPEASKGTGDPYTSRNDLEATAEAKEQSPPKPLDAFDSHAYRNAEPDISLSTLTEASPNNDKGAHTPVATAPESIRIYSQTNGDLENFLEIIAEDGNGAHVSVATMNEIACVYTQADDDYGKTLKIIEGEDLEERLDPRIRIINSRMEKNRKTGVPLSNKNPHTNDSSLLTVDKSSEQGRDINKPEEAPVLFMDAMDENTPFLSAYAEADL
ncbi:uncharacterized protein ColSpa_11420 [Colletotrichum spaethianum]|uniref:Uncharacterized protein n=1 Tax=Colletotrichum spaethianum TaxID=700344 RepID=A0AA37UKF9_9PEZI|nr:uncharacterized protein ColSpa_11420 [Colletotrichum spaethianum]GKT51239.1 hypothetical protein ColSpa_11420 [Colletotrichum spaethianum]